MRFYKMNQEGQEGYGLVARTDDDELYAYLTNTGLWHRSTALEEDFFFDQDGIYTEVGPDQVTELLPAVPRLDERGAGGRLVRRFRSQPYDDKRTSAALGLMTKEKRSATRPGFVELLAQVPRERWVNATIYESGERRAADQAAFEIRKGHKKALKKLGPLGARLAPLQGKYVLQVKKLSEAKETSVSKLRRN